MVGIRFSFAGRQVFKCLWHVLNVLRMWEGCIGLHGGDWGLVCVCVVCVYVAYAFAFSSSSLSLADRMQPYQVQDGSPRSHHSSQPAAGHLFLLS